jgi:ligand-binding sensor domain-containing protein
MKAARNNLIAAILMMLVAAAATGEELPGQAVTYANFSYVNYVASSMSHVYFATTEGIIVYDKIAELWENPLTGSVGLGSREVRRLWVDTFGEKLYAITDGQRYEYEAVFDTWYPVTEIPEIRTGTRHVATPGNMFPPFGHNYLSDGRLVDPHGRSYPITDVLDDGDGNLWLGTWGYGTATAETGSQVIELRPYGLLQNDVSDIHADDSLLWLAGRAFGSFRTGLTWFDLTANRFGYVESGIDNRFEAADIYCLESDAKAVYVGSSSGLMVYDRRLGQVTDRLDRRNGLTDDDVISLKRVGDSLFVGTRYGLNLLDFGADSISYVNPREFINRAIYDMESVNGFLWLATSSGAYRLSLKTGKVQKLDAPDLPVLGHVYAAEAYGSELWFITDAGLVRLSVVTAHTEAYQNIPGRYGAGALAVNDRIVALASDHGLTLMFREEGKPFKKEFTTEDGLPSGVVKALLLDGDYLWIGSERGLTRFWWNNPRRID